MIKLVWVNTQQILQVYIKTWDIKDICLDEVIVTGKHCDPESTLVKQTGYTSIGNQY